MPSGGKNLTEISATISVGRRERGLHPQESCPFYSFMPPVFAPKLPWFPMPPVPALEPRPEPVMPPVELPKVALS
jgi:hypothetical protein